MAEYLDRACRVLGVDEDKLASRGREPRIREMRELVAVLGVEKYGQRVCEIAGRLEKSRGSVSRRFTAAAELRSSESGDARRPGKVDKISGVKAKLL